MIKFFRKIRHQFLNENKFSKYFLYALGEIALVMIGILLALQVNNWNEGQKDRAKEETYLLRLHNDLVADTIYLGSRRERAVQGRAQIYQFIHEIYNTQKTEEDFIRLFALQSFEASSLVMQTSTFEELKNTGLISIIQNQQLKIAMIDLYREYQIAAEHFIEINSFTAREQFGKSAHVAHKYFHPDLYDDERLYEGSDWTFINDPSSENFKLLETTQGAYYIKYGFFTIHFENLLTKSKALIDQVNEELEKRS
jgi:hypothetical protein